MHTESEDSCHISDIVLLCSTAEANMFFTHLFYIKFLSLFFSFLFSSQLEQRSGKISNQSLIHVADNKQLVTCTYGTVSI